MTRAFALFAVTSLEDEFWTSLRGSYPNGLPLGMFEWSKEENTHSHILSCTMCVREKALHPVEMFIIILIALSMGGTILSDTSETILSIPFQFTNIIVVTHFLRAVTANMQSEI